MTGIIHAEKRHRIDMICRKTGCEGDTTRPFSVTQVNMLRHCDGRSPGSGAFDLHIAHLSEFKSDYLWYRGLLF